MRRENIDLLRVEFSGYRGDRAVDKSAAAPPPRAQQISNNNHGDNNAHIYNGSP